MSERSDALVLFGATGDLAKKKLYPALHQLARSNELPGTVIGVASSNWSRNELIDYARAAIEEYGDGIDQDAFGRLTHALHYVPGDYRDEATYTTLVEKLGTRQRPLIYLAIPPNLFETVIAGLSKVGLNERSRVVIEKPFGRDLASAPLV